MLGACAMLSCGFTGSTIYFFHIISQTVRFYLKTVTEYNMCVLILPKTLLVLRRIERDVIKTVHWSSCKVRVILVRF